MNLRFAGKKNSGFTLIEMITVVAVLALLMSITLINFRTASKNKTARHQVARKLMADHRQAQSFALAGSAYEGEFMCGFGIHFISSSKYVIFAKKPVGNSCGTLNNKYNSSDPILNTITVTNTNFIITGSDGSSLPNDFYYEPPTPTVYINGVYYPTLNPETYIIKPTFESAACTIATPGDNCSFLEVSNMGTINLIN